MTLTEAKALRQGDIIYHIENKNADGSQQKWKVNGMTKLWKRSPERILIPLKHGLWNYAYLTEDNLCDFTCN